MPTAKKRIAIIPDHESLAVCGLNVRPDDDGHRTDASAEVNGLIRRHARLVTRASRELEAVLTRPEWNAIADVMNGCADLYDYAESQVPPLLLLVANLEDGDRLDGLGAKWEVDVPDLCRRLRALTDTHGEAILCATRWFWRNPSIDHGVAEWWRVAARTAK